MSPLYIRKIYNSRDCMQEIIQETNNDGTLQHIRLCTLNRLPESKAALPNDVRPYFTFRDEIIVTTI